jgi:hypothetical protein
VCFQPCFTLPFSFIHPRAERNDFNALSSSSLAPPNSAASNSGFLPSLHSVEEVKPLYQKKVGSSAGAVQV